MSSESVASPAAQDVRGERPMMPGTVWAVMGLMGLPAGILGLWGLTLFVPGLIDMHNNPDGDVAGIGAALGGFMLIAAAIFGAIAWLAWMGWVVLPWVMVSIGVILVDLILQSGNSPIFLISAAIPAGLAALLFTRSARAYDVALRTWRRLARPRDGGAVPAD